MMHLKNRRSFRDKAKPVHRCVEVIPAIESSVREKSHMPNIPKDFLDALKESGLDGFFLGFAASHRREYLKWVGEAKRPEARKDRIRKAMKMLSDKRAKATAKRKRTG